jgi:putative endopeptidase
MLNPLKKSSKNNHEKIHIDNPSNTINPGKSFYNHINQAWLKSVEIPKHLNKYSISIQVEEYIDNFLHKIILDSTKNSGGEDAHVKKTIETLALSITRPEVQDNNTERLKQSVRSFACIHRVEDVGVSIANMWRCGIPTLLSISTEIHPTTKKYVMSIKPGQLSLGTPQFYFSNNFIFHSKETKEHYTKFLLFIKREFDLTQNIESAVSLEASLSKEYSLLDGNDKKIISINTLIETYPAIPWRVMFNTVGVSQDECMIICEKWIKKINKLFKTLPISEWINILSLHTLIHGLITLPEPIKSHAFQFFSRYLGSNNLIVPPPITRVLNIYKGIIPQHLTYLFIKKFLSPNGKRDATKFTQTIIDSAEKRIKTNPWLNLRGKKKVIEKIHKMEKRIYYPDVNKQPTLSSKVVLNRDCLLSNIYALSNENMNKNFELIGKTESSNKVWYHQPYIVNAYYYTDINMFCIPAASFFFPLYDPEKLGWNYGAIGSTIGHEIIHAFDEDGQMYNEDGENKPMWSSSDMSEYRKKMKKLADLFSKEKVFSVHIKGDETVSENLADLGGIQVSLHALKTVLEDMKASPEKRLYELREFFTGYATSWRTVVRRGNALTRIYTDPHAPAEQRVNLIVSQVDEWYEAFGIKETDAMYVKPEDRIIIF